MSFFGPLVHYLIGTTPTPVDATNRLPTAAEIVHPGDNTRSAELDNLFDAILTVDIAHHEAHEGDAFVCDYVDESMGSGATIELCFKTIAAATPQKRHHMTLEFVMADEGNFEMFEGVTWDTGTGTQNPIVNRFRQTTPKSSGMLEDTTSTFTATDNMVLNPTNLSVVGAVELHHLHSFGSKQTEAGGGRGVSEWILKPETLYAVVLTSGSGQNKGQVILNWYEHTDAS